MPKLECRRHFFSSYQNIALTGTRGRPVGAPPRLGIEKRHLLRTGATPRFGLPWTMRPGLVNSSVEDRILHSDKYIRATNGCPGVTLSGDKLPWHPACLYRVHPRLAIPLQAGGLEFDRSPGRKLARMCPQTLHQGERCSFGGRQIPNCGGGRLQSGRGQPTSPSRLRRLPPRAPKRERAG